MPANYSVAHLDDIPTRQEPDAGAYAWKPVRHHFGVSSFGVNLFVAPRTGDWVIEQHTETGDSGTRHEELFFVSSGRATFVVAGDEVEASAGTFVHVPDPEVSRGARALEAGTTVLAMGGEPGTAYGVSPWEREIFG